MIRIYLVLVLIILVFFALNKFLKAPPEIVSKLLKQVGIGLILFLAIFLAATGRLNWLFALVGIAVTFIVRMLPSFMRYMPQLHNLWRLFNKNKTNSSRSGTPGKYSGKMSRQEAFDVLGLTSTATKKEITMAHKKLMQKMHPDRGGSNYLAAKVNLAKRVLLEK